jgi:hypothetical protein
MAAGMMDAVDVDYFQCISALMGMEWHSAAGKYLQA